MRTLLQIILIALCPFWALSEARSNSPSAGDEIPNFSLLDYHGRFHELHRAEGKAVVLFFTGNGCPIARQSIPKLQGLKKKFSKEGVSFWAVDSYSEDDREAIAKEAKEFRYNGIPVLLDQS